MGLGRNSFNLSRNEAIATLADVIIAHTNPALRLETPRQADVMLERAGPLAQSLAALRANRSVTLTGSGGVGKTTLGSTLASQMERPVFWFTIHPGVNDHWEALLFALGYFLHTQGSSSLWLELVAATAKLKPDRMLGIARYALEQLQPEYPLICIDEVDLLEPTTEINHVLLVKFLENLRGLTPLLLIGQRPLLETNLFCTLTGLSPDATQQMFAQAHLHLTASQLHKIHTMTQGNPRLVQLLVTLQDTGEPLEETLQALGRQPALEFLLNRILQRLSEAERSVIMELAVFRRPAPAAIWEQAQAGQPLRQLLAHHLVQQDQMGGVVLLPVYQTMLYQHLPLDKREALHTAAATIRAGYGDYVSAIYHWIHAGQVEEAIWFWHQYRQPAINQGQASAALALFRNLPELSLSTVARETLQLLRAELERLTGNSAKAAEDIRSVLWRTPILALDANHLLGMIANDESDFTTAESVWLKVNPIN